MLLSGELTLGVSNMCILNDVFKSFVKINIKSESDMRTSPKQKLK